MPPGVIYQVYDPDIGLVDYKKEMEALLWIGRFFDSAKFVAKAIERFRFRCEGLWRLTLYMHRCNHVKHLGRSAIVGERRKNAKSDCKAKNEQKG